jgi:hypothetical protein
MYERFTDRARKVMQFANQEALRLNHEYIGTEHILLGLIREGSGVGANVLQNLDIDLKTVRLEVEKIVMGGPATLEVGLKLPKTPRAKRALEFAIAEARQLNHSYVGTEHLLLGLVREGEGVAAQVLVNMGLRLDDVREEVLNLLGHHLENPPQTEDTSLAADTPARIASAVKSLTELIDLFGQMKEDAVSRQDFDWAARVRDQADKLQRIRTVLLQEQPHEPKNPVDAIIASPIVVESADGPRSMFQCDLHLPAHDAAGNRHPEGKLAALERRLADRFGKIYSVPSTWSFPSMGVTEMLVWRFHVPDRPDTRDCLGQLKAELETDLGQQILIVLCPVKII